MPVTPWLLTRKASHRDPPRDGRSAILLRGLLLDLDRPVWLEISSLSGRCRTTQRGRRRRSTLERSDVHAGRAMGGAGLDASPPWGAGMDPCPAGTLRCAPTRRSERRRTRRRKSRPTPDRTQTPTLALTPSRRRPRRSSRPRATRPSRGSTDCRSWSSTAARATRPATTARAATRTGAMGSAWTPRATRFSSMRAAPAASIASGSRTSPTPIGSTSISTTSRRRESTCSSPLLRRAERALHRPARRRRRGLERRLLQLRALAVRQEPADHGDVGQQVLLQLRLSLAPTRCGGDLVDGRRGFDRPRDRSGRRRASTRRRPWRAWRRRPRSTWRPAPRRCSTMAMGRRS